MARRSQLNPNQSNPKLIRRFGAQATRRIFALSLFYVVTGMQIAEASPLLTDLLQDQPGGVRQCSRKLAGGKEDRIARSWHRNVQTRTGRIALSCQLPLRRAA